MIRYMIAATALTSGVPIAAQSCATPPGWAKPARHVAAKAPTLRFALRSGSSAQLQLHAEPMVTVPLKKDRARQPREFAGLAALNVAKAGKLEVALSDRAYIDLIRDGRALTSNMHGHKGCRGVAKTLDFDVKPGLYLVQIADARVRSIRVGFSQK